MQADTLVRRVVPGSVMGPVNANRPRARDLGLVVGLFQPGANNGITDVEGVRVGHTTVIVEPDVLTGVTAILLTNTLSA